MNKTRFSLVAVLILLCTMGAMAQTTSTRIFIVRHADREKHDDLNAAGMVRAGDLKHALFTTGIDSIFSTNFLRTKKTVAPLAEALGLPVIPYDSNPQVLKRILNSSAGKTVVVCGHSNTVAQLIVQCGCKPPFENIPDTQFDNLFLVTIERQKIKKTIKSSCRLLRMKYGVPTN